MSNGDDAMYDVEISDGRKRKVLDGDGNASALEVVERDPRKRSSAQYHLARLLKSFIIIGNSKHVLVRSDIMSEEDTHGTETGKYNRSKRCGGGVY
ncbi:hypothetical protein J7T55_002196 [Diaporthe amygdali]|uniref:uncharacterized protein n=1 Tax=Phomopsis amygdali TaxID=1214568 RepID=UPI0022FED995|nr:uncharacterized protein J7T55_002196 [Diaporthe amygdali]KAJ0103777.1 hypothetical protein J7T55_002196 [Diaporthe amygdali]